MATLLQLRQLWYEPGPILPLRVQGAVIQQIGTILIEAADVPSHAQRLAWAEVAEADPAAMQARMMAELYASNSVQTDWNPGHLNAETGEQDDGIDDYTISYVIANSLLKYA